MAPERVWRQGDPSKAPAKGFQVNEARSGTSIVNISRDYRRITDPQDCNSDHAKPGSDRSLAAECRDALPDCKSISHRFDEGCWFRPGIPRRFPGLRCLRNSEIQKTSIAAQLHELERKKAFQVHFGEGFKVNEARKSASTVNSSQDCRRITDPQDCSSRPTRPAPLRNY